MRLRKLQYKLVNYAADMYLERNEPNDWEVTLQQYSKYSAIRNRASVMITSTQSKRFGTMNT
jgi:hypothetical protein